MRLEWQIAIAFALDMAFGDPSWAPHPVRMIGRLCGRVEDAARKTISNKRVAGVGAVASVLFITGSVALGLLFGAYAVNPVAGDTVSIYLLYTSFAMKDLAVHAKKVSLALAAGDIEKAQARVGMIVGRDTEGMSGEDAARACVESVAESTADGVTAPLFYAAVGGPALAMLYKAVNTMDSMFGHRNERYLRFGWAAARLDDAANYVPARITSLFIVLSSAMAGGNIARSARILFRDGRAHPSPNAGLAEAAFAGALGVRLGGVNHYGGIPSRRPFMGDAGAPLSHGHIQKAVRLSFITSVVTMAALLGVRWLVA